jgi:hypothetical protein
MISPSLKMIIPQNSFPHAEGLQGSSGGMCRYAWHIIRIIYSALLLRRRITCLHELHLDFRFRFRIKTLAFKKKSIKLFPRERSRSIKDIKRTTDSYGGKGNTSLLWDSEGLCMIPKDTSAVDGKCHFLPTHGPGLSLDDVVRPITLLEVAGTQAKNSVLNPDRKTSNNNPGTRHPEGTQLLGTKGYVNSRPHLRP